MRFADRFCVRARGRFAGVAAALALIAGPGLSACAKVPLPGVVAAAPWSPSPLDSSRSRPGGPPTAAARCAAGDGASCYAAGRALRNEPAPDPAGAEQAARLFARGCDAHVSDACAEEGRALAWGLGLTADTRRGAALLDAACRDGSKVGCALYGALLGQGAGVPKDVARAEALLRAACDDGGEPAAQACNETALILDEKKPRPEPEIRALFRRACDLGSAWGCRNLAVRDDSLASGAALSLLERACAGDAPGACTDLGVMFREGKQVPRDPAEAARKFERACDAGDARGCHWLGLLTRSGSGVARDPARAAGLLARACDKGTQAACADLAGMLEGGEGVAANLAHARELRERACLAHEAAGCDGLTYLRQRQTEEDRLDVRRRLDHLCGGDAIAEACLAIGRHAAFGFPTDPADQSRMTSALSRACTLGSATGCLLSHDARARGKLPPDPTFLERACALDVRDGCARWAEALADGSLGRRDVAAARTAATKACDAGAQRGCAALADVLDALHAPGDDVAKAAVLREKACGEGWATSCRALAKMARAGRGIARDTARAQQLEQRADDLDD